VKQKKLVLIFLIVSLLCIAPLPLLNLFLMYQQGKLDRENITAQRLFTTDHIETTINYFAYRTLHRSLNSRQTVAGKEGFLFLGNQYAAILDKASGVYPYQESEIDQWTDKLKVVEDWYKKRNIEFILVIAPNKSSVYPEMLPDSIVYKEGETITDDIVEYAQKKDIAVLDLRKILRESKRSDLLYYKTDTHWNNKGSSIGFRDTMHFLNRQHNRSYKLPAYTLHKVREGAGDLAGFLKIRKSLPLDYEVNFAYDFNKTVRVCHGKISAEGHIVQPCKMVNNPVVNIYAVDQYTINKDAENPQKLLLLSDSFSTANSKPYNAAFSTIWKLHQGRIYGKELADFVEKHQPDIVIYQIVERDLYSPTLVAPL